MIIVLHVLVAIASIILASYAMMFPTKSVLRSTYGLIGLTLASGTYLVVLHPGHLLQTCLTGLVYTILVTVGVVMAHRKMRAVSAS